MSDCIHSHTTKGPSPKSVASESTKCLSLPYHGRLSLVQTPHSCLTGSINKNANHFKIFQTAFPFLYPHREATKPPSPGLTSASSDSQVNEKCDTNDLLSLVLILHLSQIHPGENQPKTQAQFMHGAPHTPSKTLKFQQVS